MEKYMKWFTGVKVGERWGTSEKSWTQRGPAGTPCTQCTQCTDTPTILRINLFPFYYKPIYLPLRYMAAPKAIASACAKLQGQINSCASSVSQAAGTAAAALPPMALDGDQVRVYVKDVYIN